VGAYGPAPRGSSGLLGCGSTLELVPAFTFSLDLFLRTDWELITKADQRFPSVPSAHVSASSLLQARASHLNAGRCAPVGDARRLISRPPHPRSPHRRCCPYPVRLGGSLRVRYFLHLRHSMDGCLVTGITIYIYQGHWNQYVCIQGSLESKYVYKGQSNHYRAQNFKKTQNDVESQKLSMILIPQKCIPGPLESASTSRSRSELGSKFVCGFS